MARMGGGKPRQADLRRAASTTYYALFHTLCRTCADGFIGGANADRSKPAWTQTYRSVQHTTAKKRCANGDVISRFPKEVEDFAEAFRDAQTKRHNADYDPIVRLTRSEVLIDLDRAEAAIKAFERCAIKDKRAFAAWVSLPIR